MCMSEYCQRLAFERMGGANDTDVLGIVVGVGSVWMFPSMRWPTNG
jgi:hypothetical protein